MTVTIEKAGRRFYVVGNTYAIKDQLRDAGCKWDGDRKAWWTGKADVAARLSGWVTPTEKSEGEKKDELSRKNCAGQVEYKGRKYYVVGRSDRTGKLHLTVLDCSIEFWAAESDCRWVKHYHPKTSWGGYGRGQIEVHQTVGGIRSFVERERNNRKAGVAVCAECGTSGELIRDLEDGLMKHRGCCDIPS